MLFLASGPLSLLYIRLKHRKATNNRYLEIFYVIGASIRFACRAVVILEMPELNVAFASLSNDARFEDGYRAKIGVLCKSIDFTRMSSLRSDMRQTKSITISLSKQTRG